MRGSLWFHGLLRVSILGKETERMINLCLQNGILLTNLIKKEGGFSTEISIEDFYRIRPFLRKTHSKAVILQKQGLPFLMRQLRKKCIFLLGLTITVILIFASEEFVWRFRFIGSEEITEDQFAQFLTMQSIQTGTVWKQVKLSELEKNARRYFPEITWISIRRDGTEMVVDWKENQDHVLQTEKVTGDLLSAYDGIVLTCMVRAGTAKVKPGDKVTAGQMLIEGNYHVLGDDGSTVCIKPVRAEGDVEILSSLHYRSRIDPTDNEKKYYTGGKHTAIVLFGAPMEIGFFQHFEREDCREEFIESAGKNQLTDFLLSCLQKNGILRVRNYYEYEIVNSPMSEEQGDLVLHTRLEKFLESLEEKGVQIIEKNVKITNEEKYRVLDCDLQIKAVDCIFRETEVYLDCER